MTDQPFGLRRLGQIAVTVRDLDRAVTFYRDVLGLPFLFRAPPAMAFFDLDGIRLLLGEPEGESTEHFASILYFRVDDIAGTADGLRTRGATFDRDPELVARLPDREIWLAFFKDSEGNTLALMEERGRVDG